MVLTPFGGLPTYDGETEVLRATTPVTPGATIDLVLSVQDLGDSFYDSAVFLDKFRWSNESPCASGVISLNSHLYVPFLYRD